VVVARIAKRFLKALSHPAFKRFRQGRSPAGCMKRDQRRETRNLESFRLSERIDGSEFSLPQNACRLYILIDQAFDGEYELIVKWGRRLRRKPAHIEPQCIRATAQAPYQLTAQNRRHSRR